MMKMKIVLLLVVMVVGVAQANLLQNPGFEEGAWALKNVPDAWSLSYTSWTSAWSWVDGPGIADWQGKKALKVNGWSTAADNSVYQWVDTDIHGGVEYSFSVWAKATPGNTADAQISVWWYDGDDAIGNTYLDIVTVGDTWTHIHDTDTAPAGSDGMYFSLMGEFDNGYFIENKAGDMIPNPAGGGVLYDDAHMVPEPITLSLLGLGGLALLRRKRA